MSVSKDIQTQIAALMAHGNIPGRVQSVCLCATSGNNRTYRVATTHGLLAAKHYFQHDGDSRDRLGTEFGFSTYAAKSAAGMAPAPLAIDHSRGIGLYEFIDGDPILASTVNWDRVQNAANFFLALNLSVSRAQAKALPDASEACFSILEHLDRVSGRLCALSAQVPDTAENAGAHKLIREISAYWVKLSANVLTSVQSVGISANLCLSADQRCVSPSDFGFHNALSMPDQSTRFLDFEYAGWDDPAKMTGDFFAQLAVPVPGEYFERFVSAISVVFAHPKKLVQRATILRPVYQVKWCCIALNVFLPVHLARRKFANPQLDEIEFKRTQLAKAHTIFHSLTVI
jgi:hypothetical protein